MNCLRRSSRITPIASASTALSWFCTATDDSSPKCFVSTRATCPVSGPNASSNLRSKTSATARERSANSPCTSRAVFSSSALTNSTFAPVCSRWSTRAPISIASAITAAGSSPASTPGAHELDRRRVVDRQAVDQHAVGEDGDAGVAQGCSGSFHEQDVAAYARLLTEPLRPSAERRATAERSSPAPNFSSSSSSVVPRRRTSRTPQPAPQRWIAAVAGRATVRATAALPAVFCIHSTVSGSARAAGEGAALRSGSAATGRPRCGYR